MLYVVPPHDDELTFAIEIEHVDDVEATRSIARSRRADAAAEQKPENIEDEHRSDEERDERPENREQLCEFIWHEQTVSRSNAREPCQIISFPGKR
jgi:hypothetical protein